MDIRGKLSQVLVQFMKLNYSRRTVTLQRIRRCSDRYCNKTYHVHKDVDWLSRCSRCYVSISSELQCDTETSTETTAFHRLRATDSPQMVMHTARAYSMPEQPQNGFEIASQRSTVCEYLTDLRHSSDLGLRKDKNPMWLLHSWEHT